MAVVEVRRSMAAQRDLLRAYKVFIDDQVVARLKRGDTARLSIGPGEQVVRVGVDWKRSAGYLLDGDEETTYRFLCSSGRFLTGFMDLLRHDDNTWLTLLPDPDDTSA